MGKESKKEWTFVQIELILPASAGDTRYANLIPGSGRSPGVGNGNLLQYSCLENSMVRGVCQAAAHGVAKSWTPTHPLTYTQLIHCAVQLKLAQCGSNIFQ